MSILSDRIKETRIKRGFQQEELAEMLGVTRGGYSTYETGKAAPPPERLSQLADILKVSVDYLLGRTDEPYEMYANTHNLSNEEIKTQKSFILNVEMLLREAGSTDENKLANVLEFMEFVFRKNGGSKEKK